jgi:hypothetical protein
VSCRTIQAIACHAKISVTTLPPVVWAIRLDYPIDGKELVVFDKAGLDL